jgi:hypothetical protein
VSSSEADIATLFQEGAAKRRGMALFRVGLVGLVCAVFVAVGVGVGGAFMCISSLVSGAVAVAFILEAFRNLSGPMLFVVGRVTQSGWVTDSDRGGPGDGAATVRVVKVPRVTLEVEECFERTPDGKRTERPDVPRPFVIELPQWLERLKVEQRVVLVCLPASTDPVHWRVLAG